MGLNMKVLQALYMGLPLVLMSPTNFIQKPIRWLQAMTRYRGTASGGPGFAYDLCVRRVTPQQKATLDLSAWRSAYIGAEPVRAVTLDRFAEAFAECGFRRNAFYPCYGLAEATLIVSGGHRDEPPVVGRFDADGLEERRTIPVAEDAPHGRQVVGCGQSLPGQTVRIADPETRAECPTGTMGEIWVEGPSVALGYWERPDETRETFQAYLSDTGEGPFLRTGDLGFVRDGELYIAGRLKDLIIIAGSNYYPPDIEQAVEEAHPALRPAGAAAFLAEVDGEERLVVAVEVDRSYRPRRVHGSENGQSNGNGNGNGNGSHAPTFDRQEVTNAIRRAVAERHDVMVHTLVFLQHGTLNKTSSGKIQRQACRRDFLAGSLQRIDW
jgi:acyl-CoA synthetase (AMP-forming)/AMP-acid ligase II